MEKFEIAGESGLNMFTSFVSMTKESLESLSSTIDENIKNYELSIKNAETEISETVSSREKCEKEIAKMEATIETIKAAIENVESTYQKMVDAYSSTSKGETKDIYSEIIEAAKVNCDKDVEKNRSEIARLNSDIEAIKNNIEEFDRIIDELKKSVEAYNIELDKFISAQKYMEKTSAKINEDINEISESKQSKPKTIAKKKAEATKKAKVEEKQDDEKPVIEKIESPKKDREPTLEDTIEIETIRGYALEGLKDDKKEEPVKPTFITEQPNNSVDESLKELYEMTGYKPEYNEAIPEVEKTNNTDAPQIFEFDESAPKQEEPVADESYANNFDNLFSAPTADVAPEVTKQEYNDADMSEWENLLNGADELFGSTVYEKTAPEFNTQQIKLDTDVKTTINTNETETVNQLLKPYGTSFDKLKELVSDNITYKDGRVIPFVMTPDDVVRAVNSLTSDNLKAMKTVGPEVTLIRRVKAMKEGK